MQSGLSGLLNPARQRVARPADGNEKGNERPSVETLLKVDSEYREKARAGKLRKISPKRFNPDNEAWLPILNTERNRWSFTALYSNTALAHNLGTTHDWVVIYYERDSHDGQATVITKKNSPLKGRRVIRGREVECQTYYEQLNGRDEEEED